MGLVPTPEHAWAQDSIQTISRIASDYLDLNAIETIARDASGMIEISESSGAGIDARANQPEILEKSGVNVKPKIGVLRDSAFQFYYPENLEALERAGGELVFTSPLKEKEPPDVDGFYIGGGFPETHARQLAAAEAFRNRIKVLAEKGIPIYAECGGLMYLGRSLILEGTTYPMVDVFPIEFDFHQKPQGHGYTILDVETDNPFFPKGMRIKGHEFHYSKAVEFTGDKACFAFSMQRGVGLLEKRDGICFKNVLATYTHIHALGTTTWAGALIHKAREFQRKSNPSNPS
jgi:cobyrinic acid a,c-diamide synthase